DLLPRDSDHRLTGSRGAQLDVDGDACPGESFAPPARGDRDGVVRLAGAVVSRVGPGEMDYDLARIRSGDIAGDRRTRGQDRENEDAADSRTAGEPSHDATSEEGDAQGDELQSSIAKGTAGSTCTPGTRQNVASIGSMQSAHVRRAGGGCRLPPED